MTPQELRDRTLTFAVDVARHIAPLFYSPETRETAQQLRDSSSSTASNYRAACCAKSHRDFTSKIGTALEEADESLHWLTYFKRIGKLRGPQTDRLIQEATELTRILGASARTAKRHEELHTPRGRKQRHRQTQYRDGISGGDGISAGDGPGEEDRGESEPQ